MAHQRKLIREAARVQLLGAEAPDTYATAAGARVEKGRAVPWREIDLPAIALYATEEQSDHNDTAPVELTRVIQLEIVGATRAGGTDVEDALDDLAEQIENAIDADPTLGGTAADCKLTGTQLATEAEGKKPIGMVSLTYVVTYRTNPFVADSEDDFDTANIRINRNNDVHVGNEAVDYLTDINQE